MTIQSGFFNSINGDRKYDARLFADYFATFIGNGVFPNPSTGMKVVEGENMNIVVKAGKGWINGYFVVNDSDYVLTLDNADGVLKRIDRVVMRLNYTTRQIEIDVKKSAFASSPVTPTLQRDTDAYELALADVLINNGVTQITPSAITDTRLSNELCGIVHGLVDQVSTETLYQQYLDFWNDWRTEQVNEFEQFQTDAQTEFDAQIQTNQATFDNQIVMNQQEFDDWFATIQGILDGNVAGNLLTMINQNKDAIDELSTYVNQTITDEVVRLNSRDNALEQANVNLQREVAYLKLKQDAADRVEGGALFASDYNGNDFGLNLVATKNIQFDNGSPKMFEEKTKKIVSNLERSMQVNTDSNTFDKKDFAILSNGVMCHIGMLNSELFITYSYDGGVKWKREVLATDAYSYGVHYSCAAKGNKLLVSYHVGTSGSMKVAVLLLEFTSIFNFTKKVISSNVGMTWSAMNRIDVFDLPNTNEFIVLITGKHNTYPNNQNVYGVTVNLEDDSIFGSYVTATNTSNHNYLHPTIVNIGGTIIAFSVSDNTSSGGKKQILRSLYVPTGSDGMRRWERTFVGNVEFSTTPTELQAFYTGDKLLIKYRVSSTQSGTEKIDVIIGSSTDLGVSITGSIVAGVVMTGGNTTLFRNFSLGNNSQGDMYLAWEDGSSVYTAKINIVDGSLTEQETLYTSASYLLSPRIYVAPHITKYKPIILYNYPNKAAEFLDVELGMFEPSLQSELTYKFENADFIGLFAEFKGNLRIHGFVDGIEMASELLGNEYELVGSGDNVSPTLLKLLLSRDNINNNLDDGITRILGGYA